jgi:hypothetical protein
MTLIKPYYYNNFTIKKNELFILKHFQLINIYLYINSIIYLILYYNPLIKIFKLIYKISFIHYNPNFLPYNLPIYNHFFLSFY